MAHEKSISELQDKSLEFFSDPLSYAAFSHTRDHKFMVDCVDPRIPGRVDVSVPAPLEDLKVKVQTGGGAVGVGHDRALSLTVIENRVVPIEAGIAIGADERSTVLLDAHHGCRFVNEMAGVLGEEAAPSDFTMEALERWDKLYQLGFVRSSTLRKLMDAPGAQQEAMEARKEATSLINFVNELHPARPNVRYMAGENLARVHVVNHHHGVGLDRRRQFKLYGQDAQGYHDNLAAMYELTHIPGLRRQKRELRLGALMLRTAAVRTALNQGHAETRYLEVFPSNNKTGLEIVEQAAA